MRKTLRVALHEMLTLISRPSFWIVGLGIPLAAALIYSVVSVINRNAAATQTVSQVFEGPQVNRPEGYVDLSGIIRTVPESVPAGTFIAYPDEAEARQALRSGEIAAFYVVPKDYIQTGQIRYIRPDYNPLASNDTQSSLFTWIVRVNLTGGNIMLASLVGGPLHLEEESLATVAVPNENNPLAYWTPYIITLLFYMLIMSSASLLLSSVSKEKENRIMETLLTSVTPPQLLTGKVLGLGVVGLGQSMLWLGTSYALLNLSGKTFHLPSAIHLPVSFLTWGLVFFLLGYAVYASLMAGLGALAPNLRETNQAIFVIIMPLMVPLFFSSSVFMTEPNGAIATALSLFPLSAPVAMMARLSAGGVPWWQPFLAAFLLAVTAAFIVRAVAGMFRAQTLLSGQGFKLKTYFRALVGKV